MLSQACEPAIPAPAEWSPHNAVDNRRPGTDTARCRHCCGRGREQRLPCHPLNLPSSGTAAASWPAPAGTLHRCSAMRHCAPACSRCCPPAAPRGLWRRPSRRATPRAAVPCTQPRHTLLMDCSSGPPSRERCRHRCCRQLHVHCVAGTSWLARFAPRPQTAAAGPSLQLEASRRQWGDEMTAKAHLLIHPPDLSTPHHAHGIARLRRGSRPGGDRGGGSEAEGPEGMRRCALWRRRRRLPRGASVRRDRAASDPRAGAIARQHARWPQFRAWIAVARSLRRGTAPCSTAFDWPTPRAFSRGRVPPTAAAA